MSDATNSELIRAYDLIEADELDKARNLLDSYLENDRDNPDAWWLYAHAVTEPMEAQNALRNILRLDPDYPGARELLVESEDMLTPKTNTAIPRLASRPVPIEDGERVPDFLDQLDIDDDFDSYDDDFDTADVAEASEAPRSRRMLFILAPILIAVIVLAVVVVLVNSFNQDRVVSTATPSSLAGVTSAVTPPASSSTSDAFIDSTQETAAQGFDAIANALSGYTLTENGVGVEQTSVGNTLIASICNDPASGLVATTLSTLDIVAQQSGGLTSQVDFVGVRIVDCERDNLPLRTVVVNIADAQAFADGEINPSELRTRLQPLDS